MTIDAYFKHNIPGGEGGNDFNENSIIPMDNEHTLFSPFDCQDETGRNHDMSMYQNEKNEKNHSESEITRNCPINTMQKRRIEDMDNSRNNSRKDNRSNDRGVAFRGLCKNEQTLEFDNVVGIGGEENFSYRRTMGDGSTTNTPIGDWDFEDDQKRNMNGLVDDIYKETEEKTRNDKNENGALFLKQFERKNLQPQLKDIKTGNDGQIFKTSLLSGNMGASSVSQLFYSKQNLQALQDGIRYSVFKLSDGRHNIGEQSNDELIIIMKTMYLTHGKNLMYNIVEQVRDLNKIVLDYAVPEIIEQLEMYEKYRHDKAFLPTPLDRSTSTTIKGEKTLGMRDFF